MVKLRGGILFLLFLPLLVVLTSALSFTHAYETLYTRRELLRGEIRGRRERAELGELLANNIPAVDSLHCATTTRERAICVSASQVTSKKLHLDLDGYFRSATPCEPATTPPQHHTLPEVIAATTCPLTGTIDPLIVSGNLFSAAPVTLAINKDIPLRRLGAKGSVIVPHLKVEGAAILVALGSIQIGKIDGSGTLTLVSTSGKVAITTIGSGITLAIYSKNIGMLPTGFRPAKLVLPPDLAVPTLLHGIATAPVPTALRQLVE